MEMVYRQQKLQNAVVAAPLTQPLSQRVVTLTIILYQISGFVSRYRQYSCKSTFIYSKADTTMQNHNASVWSQARLVLKWSADVMTEIRLAFQKTINSRLWESVGQTLCSSDAIEL